MVELAGATTFDQRRERCGATVLETLRGGSRQICVCGHGGWTLKNGYTSVPAKSSITFYTQNAKLMNQTEVEQVIRGTYPGQPDCHVAEFKTAPNMTLYQDDAQCRIESINACPGDKGLLFWRDEAKKKSVTLKEIFDALPGHDFVWVCCRELALKSTTRGKEIGVNAGETNDSYHFFDPSGQVVAK
jgi:hypothetical protein